MGAFMRGQHIPRAVEHSRVVLQGLSENLYSRVVDRFASAPLPPLVMVPFLKAYCRVYGVNTDELPSPFHSYRNFREFFARPVRTGLRHVDSQPARLTSPVDGAVLATGTFQDTPLRTLRIKGRLYTMEDLLGTEEIPEGLRTGGFTLFYLAPGDYHRFHSPLDGTVTGYDYLPGTCRPVNEFGRRIFPHLYVTNRRIVLWLRSDDTPPLEACLVLIGAMGVGRIVVRLGDEQISGSGDVEQHVRFDAPRPVERGEEIGRFDLGSSAILIWSTLTYRSTILAHEGPVKLGTPVVALGDRKQGELDA
jgi:phosphatidylserine decarboxylase